MSLMFRAHDIGQSNIVCGGVVIGYSISIFTLSIITEKAWTLS